MQRLLPPLLVTLLLAAMICASFVLPAPSLPGGLRLAGVVPLLAGLALTVRHAKLFASVGTNIKTFDDPDQLVQQGAFRWSRNPMYLGFALLLGGAALVVGSAVAFAGPVIFIAAADRWYIPFEERRLTAIFGGDYDAYRALVRRWVGRRSAA